MSALPIIPKQNSVSVGLFTHWTVGFHLSPIQHCRIRISKASQMNPSMKRKRTEESVSDSRFERLKDPVIVKHMLAYSEITKFIETCFEVRV